MDPLNTSTPTPASNPGARLADAQLVAMRAKYGDEHAEHLAKVMTALGQYLVVRTNSPAEGLDVITNLKEALELAIKLNEDANPTTSQ